MYIENIENSIIEKLQASFPVFQTESFPANFSEFSFTRANGCLLVRYQGSSFSGSKAIGFMVQEERIEFSIFIALRYLNSFQEAYPHLKQVKQTLTGFKPEGCSKLQPTKAEFLDEENGDLWYGMTFSLTRTAVETTEAEQLPILKKITLNSEYKTVEVTKE